jgi:photosystem II stability/assembly factor-like uncharacterized protein
MCRGRLPFLLLVAISASAQVVPPSWLKAFDWRSIGPAATGGRIADIAASRIPGRPAEIYVATTTGGIFKSTNEGVSWLPVFDRAGGMMSIGAVAVAPSNPSIVWAGTGEADNRQSSSWGDGVYKSTDGGASWQKAGLDDTRHVGRIVIHPGDPNTVYVAAVGHLWGPNPERGVFKTSDGGQTWKKVLYKDENTGAIDLVMDPRDPNVLFAAMYQRQRKGWGFNGGGPGSGLFRTTDGGATWTELTAGLPQGDKGRIGICPFAADSRILYAIVEAEGGGVFRSIDRGDTWEHMSGMNPRPMYYSRIFVDPREVNRVYIMGSNRGFYISDDAGRSFRDVFSGVHGEDHALWIDPDNTNHLVIGGDGGVSISFDRGMTWLFRINLPIGQFYNISVNNGDPFLICGGLQDNGSWCTPSATNIGYGVSFRDAFNVGGGDGMHALFEGDDHTLLVASQNGVTARLDLDSMERQSIGPVQPSERPRPGEPAYRWYWSTPLLVSQFDPATIYTGANVLFRSTDRGVSWKAISPDLTSAVDREKLEMMGGRVPPRALSRHDGQTNFSALTVIAESPLDRNLLYTGADDGTIQRTRDGGLHWTNITENVRGLPPMLNISGIIASKFAAGRVYLTVDGHFNDDYHPYIFVSENYGQTWRPIATGLPQASVHRIREHPANPDFLVAGLEMGVWATFDRGANWVSLGTNMPPVPVYDLAFQERSGALVAGTHGRGIWVLDHAEPLAYITSEVLNGAGHLFPPPPARHQVIYGGQFWFGAGEYFAPNPPTGAVLTWYLPKEVKGGIQVTISNAAGVPVRTLRGSGDAGFNRGCWDLRRESPAVENPTPGPAPCVAAATSTLFPRGGGSGPFVPPGTYRVTVATGQGDPLTATLQVGPDSRFPISDADRASREASLMSAYALQRQLVAVRASARSLGSQLTAIREQLVRAGEGGKTSLPAVDRATADVGRVQNQVNTTIAAAGRAQNAIDGYAGLPTAAQLRDLEWAWADGLAAVNTLNDIILHQMPAIYATAGDASKWPEAKPVPALTRP